MLAEIQFGLTSAKAAFDLLKGINTITVEADKAAALLDIRERVSDAQGALIAAQEAYTAVIEREKTLKAEIAQLKDWTAEKARYERADTGQGAIAYRPKPGMEKGEPLHWLCPQCFLQGKPNILQPERLGPMAEALACNDCGTQLMTRGGRHHVLAPPRRGR